MISPEIRQKPQVMVKAIEFSTPFPASGPEIGQPSINDFDNYLAKLFSGIGSLRQSIEAMIAINQRREKVVGAGLLNLSLGYRNTGNRLIELTPMGANESVLLGCFRMSELLIQHTGDAFIADFFGEPVNLEPQMVGYVSLDRTSLHASGFGIMSYCGSAFTFDTAPKDEALVEAALLENSESSDRLLSIARMDLPDKNNLSWALSY